MESRKRPMFVSACTQALTATWSNGEYAARLEPAHDPDQAGAGAAGCCDCLRCAHCRW